MTSRHVKVSKFLSLVLRHQPGTIGLILGPAGWVAVEELLRASKAHGFPISADELKTVVAENDKQRFAFSDDGASIRASQGHSIEIELGYAALEPPPLLYHGTPERFVRSIQAEGLVKGQRHHVHLSKDVDTARKVGARRGKPVILEIASGPMHRDGHVFYLSDNGVWLTDHVPPVFLTLYGAPV